MNSTGAAPTFSNMIFESVPNPMLVIDEANDVVCVNTAAENFFQTSSKTLSKAGISMVIPATSPILGLMDDVRKSQSSINERGIVIGTPRAGGEHVADLQLAPVSDKQGWILLQVLQRSVAQKIDRQLTHRSAARTVTGMAEMLAHEIKNPLSGIRGAAQLLESGLDAADLELTELIVSETDRIRDLVNQMEEFSDERPILRTAINVHSVLSHVRKVAATGFARGIKIAEVYDPSLPSVLGNRDQLVQVIMNLVKNAAEAIEEGGGEGEIVLSTSYRPGVHLSVKGSGERVALPFEVKVSNTGPGISPDIADHLFDPFVSSKPNGKGLGLALTAKIVGDHGGVIECDRVGDETVFTILLPMSKQDGDSNEHA